MAKPKLGKLAQEQKKRAQEKEKMRKKILADYKKRLDLPKIRAPGGAKRKPAGALIREKVKQREFLTTLREAPGDQMQELIEEFVGKSRVPRERDYFRNLTYITPNQIRRYAGDTLDEDLNPIDSLYNYLHEPGVLNQVINRMIKMEKTDQEMSQEENARRRLLNQLKGMRGRDMPPVVQEFIDEEGPDRAEFMEELTKLSSPRIRAFALFAEQNRSLSTSEALETFNRIGPRGMARLEEEVGIEEEEEVLPYMEPGPFFGPRRRPGDLMLPGEAIRPRGPSIRSYSRAHRRPSAIAPRRREEDVRRYLRIQVNDPNQERIVNLVRSSIRETLATSINRSNADPDIIGQEIEPITRDSPFVVEMENIIFDRITESRNATLAGYFGIVADIIVPLNEQYHNLVYKTRIKEELYTPRQLVNLSLKDRFPEIFRNKSVGEETESILRKRIASTRRKFISEQAEYLYRILNPGAQFLTRPQLVEPIQPFPDVGDRLSDCDNPWDLLDEIPQNIVKYSEGGEVWCFNLLELRTQFGEGNYINGYTGNRFSQQFIDRIMKYDPERLQRAMFEEMAPEEEERMVERLEEVLEEPELAPGFLDILSNALEEMEGRVGERMSFGSASEEDDEEEDSEESSSDFEFGDSSDSGSENRENCEHCGNSVSRSRGQRTVVYRGSEPHEISFCGFDCFEKAEKWPKRKRKKK